MQCPNCGCDLKPGAKFCFNCGFYLDNGEDEKKEDISSGKLNDIPDDSIDFSEDDSSFNTSKKQKKTFDFKDNIVYIVLGIVLIISLILLVYGIVSKNSQSKVPVTPPASMKPEMKITVEDYKLTVPAGLDYQIEGKSVFISDDEKYNFSFRINKGDYDNYSKNMDTLSEELKKSNYNIKSAEKKTIGEDELLVYTISLDSDIKYLYLTKYNSEKISMGVISIHNRTNIDEICKVILKVTKSVKYDNESEDKSSETVNSDTAFKETSSIVNGVKNLFF